MTSHLENIAGVVADQLGQVLERIPSTCGELTFEVTAAQLLSAAATLREHPALRFEMLIDLCGIDYLDYGKVEWQTTEATDSGFSRGVPRRHFGASPRCCTGGLSRPGRQPVSECSVTGNRDAAPRERTRPGTRGQVPMDQP